MIPKAPKRMSLTTFMLQKKSIINHANSFCPTQLVGQVPGDRIDLRQILTINFLFPVMAPG